MPSRPRDEWIGRKVTSMPSINVLLAIVESQGGLCGCGCGIEIDYDRDELDCDHINPLKDGGENRQTNLQVILRKHHRAKTTAENIARGAERRHKAKAFTAKRKSSFATNRDAPFKKKMDGTVVRRHERT